MKQEKIIEGNTSDEKSIKNIYKSTTKRQKKNTPPIKIMIKSPTKHFYKEDTQIQIKNRT